MTIYKDMYDIVAKAIDGAPKLPERELDAESLARDVGRFMRHNPNGKVEARCNCDTGRFEINIGLRNIRLFGASERDAFFNMITSFDAFALRPTNGGGICLTLILKDVW